MDADKLEILREELAEYAHQTWAGWMKYLFDQCCILSDNQAILPTWAVERWKRQMNTSYSALPKEEQNSDRNEADHMLDIVRQYVKLQEGGE